jgi:hypothetical protein
MNSETPTLLYLSLIPTLVKHPPAHIPPSQTSTTHADSCNARVCSCTLGTTRQEPHQHHTTSQPLGWDDARFDTRAGKHNKVAKYCYNGCMFIPCGGWYHAGVCARSARFGDGQHSCAASHSGYHATDRRML